MVRSALSACFAWFWRYLPSRRPIPVPVQELSSQPMAHTPQESPDPTATSPLRKLANWIPGLGDYARGEDHRQQDLADRAWVADRLQQAKQGLERYARLLVDAGQHDLLVSVDRLRHETDRLSALVRGTPSGSSVASQSHAELLVDYNHQLIQQSAEIADAMEDLVDAPTTKPATNRVDPLADIASRLAKFTTTWEARTERIQCD